MKWSRNQEEWFPKHLTQYTSVNENNIQRWSRLPLLQLLESSRIKKYIYICMRITLKRQKKEEEKKNKKTKTYLLNVFFSLHDIKAEPVHLDLYIFFIIVFKVTWSREHTKCTILLEWQSISEKWSRERAAVRSPCGGVLFFPPLFIFLKLPNPVVIVVMHYIGTAKTSALLL